MNHLTISGHLVANAKFIEASEKVSKPFIAFTVAIEQFSDKEYVTCDIICYPKENMQNMTGYLALLKTGCGITVVGKASTKSYMDANKQIQSKLICITNPSSTQIFSKEKQEER